MLRVLFLLAIHLLHCFVLPIASVYANNQKLDEHHHGAVMVSATIELRDEKDLPRLGIGTAALRGYGSSVVEEALSYGVMLIDTAQAPEWYSEAEVGRGIESFLAHNDLMSSNQCSYGDIYIVTKIHPRSFERTAMNDALTKSRNLLTRNTKPLDLVLLHSPYCWEGHCTSEQLRHTWQDAWRNLEEQKRDGFLVNHIGVSNFDLPLLQELLQLTTSKANNNGKMTQVTAVQNWCDPFHQDREVRAFLRAQGIQYMAYSTLGSQWLHKDVLQGINPVLTDKTLSRIAATYSVTVAEVVICWALQEGMVVIPRSTNSEHLLLNSFRGRRSSAMNSTNIRNGDLKCFLAPQDMQDIQQLDGTLGVPWD